MPAERKLRVFLCHASQDKPIVRELYQRLLAEGWIDPWLDEEKLLPGQDWDIEITKALFSADAVTVCLSSTSISREGYVRKEINNALEKLKEKPEDSNYFIPVRLEECRVPQRLQQWQYVDFFPDSQKEQAYARLLAGLKLRANILGLGNVIKIESISVQKALVEFGQEIALTILLPSNQLLEFFRSKASRFLNTDNMFIALRDDERLEFGLVYENGVSVKWPTRSAKVGRIGEILRSNNSIFLPSRADIEEWFVKHPNENETTKSMCWLGVPMLVRNEVIGVVVVFHPNEYIYDRGDLEVLETLANLAAIALNNAQLYEEARVEVIAAKQLSTLGTAIAALQHRINNTFNIIIPNVTRLRSRVDLSDPAIVDTLDIIERNARYTSAIIARIQEPLREVETTNINVNATLEEIIIRKNEAWKARVTIPYVQLTFVADERIPIIRGPSGQIAEIFDNLIENAYQAMPKGGEIRVVSELNNGTIMIKVIDCGRGIPQDIQDRLFKKPVPSRQPGAGAGLGLWLSLLMLQSIGGDIKIESSSPAGTTMVITIPVN